MAAVVGCFLLISVPLLFIGIINRRNSQVRGISFTAVVKRDDED